jgi:hypothetical protein
MVKATSTAHPRDGGELDTTEAECAKAAKPATITTLMKVLAAGDSFVIGVDMGAGWFSRSVYRLNPPK